YLCPCPTRRSSDLVRIHLDYRLPQLFLSASAVPGEEECLAVSGRIFYPLHDHPGAARGAYPLPGGRTYPSGDVLLFQSVPRTDGLCHALYCNIYWHASVCRGLVRVRSPEKRGGE